MLIAPTDFERSLAFYGDTLGLRIYREFGAGAATPVINTTPGTGVALPGLNPAHGQPGHRCDIAVAAPLNSKPKNK